MITLKKEVKRFVRFVKVNKSKPITMIMESKFNYPVSSIYQIIIYEQAINVCIDPYIGKPRKGQLQIY